MSSQRAFFRIAVGIGIVLITGLGWIGLGSKQHSVTLTWKQSPSTSASRVVGYNVYRSVTSGGPFARIATRVVDPAYEDRSVNSGTTYFYVVTAVDSVSRESGYSAEIKLTVP